MLLRDFNQLIQLCISESCRERCQEGQIERKEGSERERGSTECDKGENLLLLANVNRRHANH